MHNDRYPAITVLMPVYNAERYVKSAMVSILDQTFTDFELLIIDDGSTDKTDEILAEFNDSRIRVVKNEVNSGIVYSLNKGVALARGKYIARMDADDISEPNRLMLQHDYMANHPEVDLCGSGMILFNDGGVIGKIYYSLDLDALKAEALFNSPFPHPGVMIKREILLNNPYRAEALHAEDYDLWSRLLRNYRGMNLPDFLLRYRISSDNLTALATKRDEERKKIISAIHQSNFSYLGYEADESTLNLHFQLSSTYTIKQMSYDRGTMYKISKHFRALSDKINQTDYCSQHAFHKLCGKIFIKLFVYNYRKMGVRNLLFILMSKYLWVGLIDFVSLRFKYISGIRKK